MDANRQLLEFIIRYKSTNDGNSPSIREMMRAIDSGSTSVVGYRLRDLEDCGLIERDAGQSRCIVVKGGRWTHPTLD